jgi:hypothetical protein
LFLHRFLFWLSFYMGVAARITEVASHTMDMVKVARGLQGLDIKRSPFVAGASYSVLRPVVLLAQRAVLTDNSER